MKVKTTTITEQNVITFFVQKKFGIEFFFRKIEFLEIPCPLRCLFSLRSSISQNSIIFGH
jgi:hypothetical protein